MCHGFWLLLRATLPVIPVRLMVALLLLSVCCAGQDSSDNAIKSTEIKSSPINVNWLYGAYLPRNVELKALTGHQRMQLYFRQTYATWGIYAKTAAFSLADQADNSPPEWGDGADGFGKRFGSRYGQFAIQNTLSSTGNYLLGYEPRYDRCRCSGGWRRVGHALLRNFVTYNSTERDKRPQIALYLGAMGAGMIESTWKPGAEDPWRSGYQSVLTQVAFGSFANVVGEFAPGIGKILKRKWK
jgi:hypothetical protein